MVSAHSTAGAVQPTKMRTSQANFRAAAHADRLCVTAKG